MTSAIANKVRFFDNRPLRELNLFSGVGMIARAANFGGFETVAFCEVDKRCWPVLRKNFPGARVLPDVTTLDIADVPGPVDVVTFGSPCQDMSVAGKQVGLAGERSGLFYEAIRIIRQLRERDGSPRYAIWENVPGALSSNEGADFTAVIDAFCDIGARDVAWRVLDAQFVGVPQRRRRIFLVADFGGESAAEILSLTGRLRRNPPTRRKARPQLASDVAACLRSRGSGKTGLPGTDAEEGLVVTCFDWQAGGSQGGSIALDVATTLQTRQVPAIQQVAGTLMASGAGTARVSGMGCEDSMYIVAPAPGYDGLQAPLMFDFEEQEEQEETEGDGIISICSIGRNMNQQGKGWSTNNPMFTLTASDNHGVALPLPGDVIPMAVRRLTPLECTRLMGLPDDWFDGLNLSDSAIYQMTGNGCVPQCLIPVFGRMADFLRNC